MTNGHEASNEADITLHEKLCAYILGEANDDERAEVERALANSAELRAERERLESTIGLVRNVMSNGETLSPEATADALSAVSVKKSRPWYFSTPMRIAAGIAAVTLVYVVFQSSDRGEHHQQLADDRLAQLDEPMRKERELDRDVSELSSSQGAKKQRVEEKPMNSAGIPAESLQPLAPTAPQAKAESMADRMQLAAASAPTKNTSDSAANGAGSGGANQPVVDRKASSPAESTSFEQAPVIAQSSPSTQPHEDRIDSTSSAVDSTAKAQSSYERRPSSGLSGISSGGPASRPAGPSTSNSVGQVQARVGNKSADAGVLAGGDDYFLSKSDGTSTNQRLAFAEPSRLKGLGYAGDDSSRAKDGASDVLEKLKGLGYTGDDDEAELLNQLKKYRPEHRKYQELLERLSKRNLSAEQREQIIDEQCRYILDRCRRQPNERPRDMFFRFWGDNAFQLASLEAQSTFSVDVDTASYALARRYLNEGQLPEKAQVRTEEFINYFKPDVTTPREGTFGIMTELAPSRFSNDAGRSMLRVVVRGREVTKQERKPIALTFVIDCSGSMIEQNRLEMVKHSIRLLMSQLDGNDSIAIVAFSTDARLILPMTSAARRDLIESALLPLKPENSTNSEAGLKMGFEVALAGINANANNRVVFLSDGVANVGETDPAKLAESVKRIREKGIYLNSIGVGMNNHNDALLEQLADKGDGVCNYIDSPDEAKRVMVDNFTGTMETIARDVKIQVEFDPAQVFRYRLLGYEDRFIANKDFRNDKIDAGEVGAGHQLCALYELELANNASLAGARANASPNEDSLASKTDKDTGAASKPADEFALAKRAGSDTAPKPLAVVRLRWKAPRDVRRPEVNEEASEIEKPVLARDLTSYEGASFGYKRAVIVAQFAEFLRRSTHARGRSFDDLLAEARNLEKQGKDEDFTELVTLLEKSRALILANVPQCDELCQTIDVIRRNQILHAEHDLLSVERDQKTLDQITRENAELEARIRELLRRKLEETHGSKTK